MRFSGKQYYTFKRRISKLLSRKYGLYLDLGNSKRKNFESDLCTTRHRTLVGLLVGDLNVFWKLWSRVWSSSHIHRKSALQSWTSANGHFPLAGIFQSPIGVKRAVLLFISQWHSSKAWIFSFLNVDHVIILKRNVFFKFFLIYLHMYAKLMKWFLIY